jgi:DNA-binding winged helix-turn-helix (wHTH) protein/Tfp pilus assembly protein PilF
MRGFQLDDRLIFPDLNIVVTNGASVHVEPKVMQVLVELARQPGELISKAQILESVWTGLFVCDDVVANAVSLLRRALGDEAKRPTLIQTVPKRGYRLLCAVEWIDKAPFPGSRRLEGDLNRCLLRVRHLRQEETEPSLRSAYAYAEAIAQQAPESAAAYAELALTLFSLLKLCPIQRNDIEMELRSAVDKAVRLDERAGITLVCRAKLESRFDGDWENAERHLRGALHAGWQDPDVLTECSTLLSAMRRFDESMVLAERACLLDPLSAAARLQAGNAYSCNSRWEAAAASYRRLLRFSPQHVFARWGLASALILAGEPQEAIAAITDGFAAAGTGAHPLLFTPLLRAQELVAPSRSRAAAAADEFQRRTNDPVLLAELYCSIGATDKAFGLLDVAADMMHYRISAVNMFPQFGAIREDGRYHGLRKRVGLTG